jgi:hypothetical protein
MKKLNSNHLKLIAIIAMTIDHIADLLYPGMPNNIISNVLHVVGRVTAPIMFFFICEGFYYTKNLKKYILRLLLFAIVSHFAYCFAFGINFIPFINGNIFNQTSIMWTLLWSVVGLWIVFGKNNFKEWQRILLVILLNLITFSADWSSIGLMIILSMYEHRGDLKKQMKNMMFWTLIYAIVSFVFVSKTYGIIQLFVILVYPLLKLYNGEVGKVKWMKWFFYVYYPLHLVLIGIIRLLVYGNVSILF